MQNLLDELKKLLEKDKRLVVDGKLLKNKIVELALNLDPELLHLLLSNESIKKHFFVEVDGMLVFDKIKFQRFVSNKQFLPDSYTAYKNKIGLAIDSGDYLSESKEVVLVWPYKDCVLEGGMEREDEKRDEIFFNETLAPDDIDRLFNPKVLTNFKRIDKDGEHSLTDFERDEHGNIKDNLIIKGNNLLALHSLKKQFAGKVKLIYIDPPYNRDADTFYNDSFKHSTWLTFMKNRMEFAKDLLSDDGAIFVQISDVNEGRLRLLMDEVFSRENFINKVTVRTKSPSGFQTVNLGVFEVAEYILVYGKKRREWEHIPQYVPSGYDDNYSLIVVNKEDPPEKWVIEKLSDHYAKQIGYDDAKQAAKRLGEDVFLLQMADFALENADTVFRCTAIGDDASQETVKIREISKKKQGAVFIVKREEYDDRFILNGSEITFYRKKIKEIDGVLTPTTRLTNIWTDISWEGIASEGGVKLKRGKKPEKLIRRIIEMSTEPGDLIVDFFLGSGTTSAVAHKLGRQYIGIEQLDYAENDSVARLKNVINGDSTGISKVVDWRGGGKFVYCELIKSNEVWIDEIERAKTTHDLKAIWEKMKEKTFLSYKIDAKAIDENMSAFEALNFEEQKRVLVSLLDKNALYVDYCDIDDVEYGISDEDKKLNHQFHGD